MVVSIKILIGGSIGGMKDWVEHCRYFVHTRLEGVLCRHVIQHQPMRFYSGVIGTGHFPWRKPSLFEEPYLRSRIYPRWTPARHLLFRNVWDLQALDYPILLKLGPEKPDTVDGVATAIFAHFLFLFLKTRASPAGEIFAHFSFLSPNSTFTSVISQSYLHTF